MSELKSGLSRDDLETLIEAVNDWEAIGNHEYHVMRMVENAPLPPEDHEAHEFVANIKNHFRERKKEIKSAQEVRQEKAVFLKAKLMLIRRDIGIGQLFEQSSAIEDDVPPRPVSKPKVKIENPDTYGDYPPIDTDVDAGTLEAAVFFMKDLGVWNHYQKFLSERKAEIAARNKSE